MGVEKFDLDGLDDQVFALLYQRAAEGTLTDTALTKLVDLATKRQDAKAKEASTQEREPTPLEIVESAPGLPVQRKAEILMGYARDLRAELDLVEKTLGGLGGD